MSALIPVIRRVSPRTKIIYRSHIQSERLPCFISLIELNTDESRYSFAVRADLIDQKVEQQTTTWDYLWSFIRLADLFVAVRSRSQDRYSGEANYLLRGFANVASSRRVCSSNRQRFNAYRLHASFVLPSLLSLRS